MPRLDLGPVVARAAAVPGRDAPAYVITTLRPRPVVDELYVAGWASTATGLTGRHRRTR